MTGPENLGELAVAFATLNERVAAGDDPSLAPQRLVELAVTTIPGCDSAAITVWPARRRPHSLAASDDTADVVDQLQYELRDGPCLTAAVHGEHVHLPDLADRAVQARWPEFTQAAMVQTPVRGVQAFPLLDEPSPSALNLYASRAGAFDAESVTVAAIFAAHARVLLMHNAKNDQAANLTRALTASRQIGVAVGILMKLYTIDSDRAFQVLTRASQTLNQKLSSVAAQVTETGTLPDLPEQRVHRRAPRSER